MINPLIVTMSVRDFPIFEYWRNQIRLCDRLEIKNFIHEEAHEISRKYFLDNKQYTHYIMLAEDVIARPDDVKLLLEDIEKYDYPVVCGYCNINFRNDWVCLTKIDILKKPIVNANDYEFYTTHDILRRKENNYFDYITFQGNALTSLRRDVIEKIEFKPDRMAINKHIMPNGKKLGTMFDLALCKQLARLNIPIAVDLRILLMHFGNTVNFIDLKGKERTVTLIKPDGRKTLISRCKPYF
jgi:hypothetical protein